MGKKILILLFFISACNSQQLDQKNIKTPFISSFGNISSDFYKKKTLCSKILRLASYCSLLEGFTHFPKAESSLFYETFSKDTDFVSFLDLTQDSDDNYLIVGSIGTLSNRNGYIVEYDSTPGIVNSFFWNTSGEDRGVSIGIEPVTDNIAVSGDSNGLGSGLSEQVFFMLRPSYNFLCGRSIKTSGDTINTVMKVTTGGQFITVSSTNDGGTRALITFFAFGCSLVWINGYSFIDFSNLVPVDVTETSYGFAVLCDGRYKGNEAVLIFTIDRWGIEIDNAIVNTPFSGLLIDSYSLIADQDDNLYFSGAYNDLFGDASFNEKYFAKLTADLSLSFFNTYGTNDGEYLSGMKEILCPDGSIVAVGQTSTGSGDNTPTFIKFSQEGEILVSTILPGVSGVSSLQIQSAVGTSSGDIALVGYEDGTDPLIGLFAVIDQDGNINNCTSNFTFVLINVTDFFFVNTSSFIIKEYNSSFVTPFSFTNSGFDTLTSESICIATGSPTASPTSAPSIAPSQAPTLPPTIAPSTAPSQAPTEAPSSAPSMTPTVSPTSTPTITPSAAPTAPPSMAPTNTPRCDLCFDVHTINNSTNSSTIGYIINTIEDDSYCYGNDTERGIKFYLPVCDFETILTIEQNCNSPLMNNNDQCPNYTLPASSSFYNYSLSLDECFESPIVINITLSNSIIKPGGTLILGDEIIGCDTCTDVPQLYCRPKETCECMVARPFVTSDLTGIEYIFEQSGECFDQQTVKYLNIDLPECLSISDLEVTSNCILADLNNDIICESNATMDEDYSNPASISLSGCPQDIFYLNITTPSEQIGFVNDTITSIQQSSSGGTSYIGCEECTGFIGFRCLTTPPTNAPSIAPTDAPTIPPTDSPTHTPTIPTDSPTNAPTISPTIPTESPTNAPTYSPTLAPTAAPTPPSESPTVAPSLSPTVPPTAAPTPPSESPTATPTAAPTSPTESPTLAPTVAPTSTPTAAPTSPSVSPTTTPTTSPTLTPTNAPSGAPTIPIPGPKLTQGEKAAIWIPIVSLVLLSLIGFLLYLRYRYLKSRKNAAALVLYDIVDGSL